jgi:hypothetical protein
LINGAQHAVLDIAPYVEYGNVPGNGSGHLIPRLLPISSDAENYRANFVENIWTGQ